MTELQSRKTGLIVIATLFLFGVVISAIINREGWDLSVSMALHESTLGESGWLIGKMSPWAAFYRFGEYPAVIMAIIAFIGYVLTLIGKFPRKYAKPFLVIVLTVILGPGLIVNGILKPFWGRPRPADTVMFGGKEPYRNVFQPTGPGGGKSFVCGHCANAFAIASGVSFFPYSPGLAGLFLGAGLTMGTLGSFARIAQGGHYLSDTLWAGIIVLSIIAWLYFCVFKIPVKPDISNKNGNS
jgi:membrane-associated PAP2 superfamily phosphatase